MNARQAKREACWRAAGLIRDAMEMQGWPAELVDEHDYAVVAAALLTLVAELERRGSL